MLPNTFFTDPRLMRSFMSTCDLLLLTRVCSTPSARIGSRNPQSGLFLVVVLLTTLTLHEPPDDYVSGVSLHAHRYPGLLQPWQKQSSAGWQGSGSWSILARQGYARIISASIGELLVFQQPIRQPLVYLDGHQTKSQASRIHSDGIQVCIRNLGRTRLRLDNFHSTMTDAKAVS